MLPAMKYVKAPLNHNHGLKQIRIYVFLQSFDDILISHMKFLQKPLTYISLP